MKTRCRRCRRLIEFRTTYCDDCKSVIIKNNKAKNKQVEKTIKSGRWKALRSEIIRRDKCCIYCFMNEKVYNLKNLQVHHIEKRVDNPDRIYDPTNLITLCRNCHEKIEKLTPYQQFKIFGGYLKEIERTLL